MSRLPSTGPSLLRKLRQAQRQALRQAQSSAFTRSGASVSNPGMLSSDDFDGVDRTHLGTSGWALGSFDGGPSFLALNGLDVFAKLTEKDAELTAMQATLTAAVADIAAQQATLTATVADLASRVTVTTSIATFDTPYLPNDSAWHDYGANIPITIAVPTGKLVVTVGCGTAEITAGGAAGTVFARATFSISGGIANYDDVYAGGTAYDFRTDQSLSVTHAFTVPPGTYTITGKMRAMSTGSATGFVTFNNPYLTVQVTG